MMHALYNNLVFRGKRWMLLQMFILFISMRICVCCIVYICDSIQIQYNFPILNWHRLLRVWILIALFLPSDEFTIKFHNRIMRICIKCELCCGNSGFSFVCFEKSTFYGFAFCIQKNLINFNKRDISIRQFVHILFSLNK